MKNYALLYGSLKSNGYNFNRFGNNTQKVIKHIELDGFEIYDLGYYPGLCKGNGEVKFELQEIEPGAYRNIVGMEIGAGYKEEIIEIDGIKASVFTMAKEKLSKYKKIENGDWQG